MDASDDFKERITIPERDGFATREENVCIIYRSVYMTDGICIHISVVDIHDDCTECNDL